MHGHTNIKYQKQRANICYEICALTSVCLTSQAGIAKAVREVAHLNQQHSWDLNSVLSGFQPDMLLPT